MTQPTPGETNPREARDHPEFAVVLIARAATEELNAAVQAATVLAGYGVEVLLLAPSELASAAAAESGPANLRWIAIAPDTDVTDCRAQALAETGADVIEFVDARLAPLISWDEVAPVRLGIVEVGWGAPMTALRASLERLAVPEPDEPSAGAV
ncbi:MAG TPA: hypothetical protein VH879_12350 [Gemmatimonadales bacterium]|jgi:hypothetical protein